MAGELVTLINCVIFGARARTRFHELQASNFIANEKERRAMKEEKFGFVFKFFEYAETHVAVLLLFVPTLARF